MQKNKNLYDAIVVGQGSMGSAALAYLAGANLKVLGIEQFGPLHERGSYSGYTRIIRKAYFEHPDYVPLLDLAYNEWRELEERNQTKFFHRTGLLYIDSENGPIGNGVLRSASKYQIEIDSIDQKKATEKYPAFVIGSDTRVLFEKDAGYLEVDKSILALQEMARTKGAEIRYQSRVESWQKEGDVICLIMETGEKLYTKKLVLCAGAYTSKLLHKLAIPLSVTSQLLLWIETNLSPQQEANLPCWTYCTPGDSRIYYGFPARKENGKSPGLKIAYHSPGSSIDPDNLSSIAHKDDLDKIHDFLNEYLPGVFKKTNETKNCLYTNTPDEHFILDYLPATDQQVIIAAGFSGHGFKFVPAIGKIISTLVLEESLNLSIGFLNLSRFSSEM